MDTKKSNEKVWGIEKEKRGLLQAIENRREKIWKSLMLGRIRNCCYLLITAKLSRNRHRNLIILNRLWVEKLFEEMLVLGSPRPHIC